MGSRGSSSLREKTSEKGLKTRAEEIHKILNEAGIPAKKSIDETVELLRKRDRENGLVFNKKPDPSKMDSSDVYREIDRTSRRLDKAYSEQQIITFKRNYNNARSKYTKGDVAGAERLLDKVPYDYIRFRALDEYMYGYPDNKRNVNFYTKYH